jgi:CheY-like chemotaxis protein
VIDDDEQIQHFLRTVLQGAGYAVVTADNRAKGIQQYRHKQTDLILKNDRFPVFVPARHAVVTCGRIASLFTSVQWQCNRKPFPGL